MNVDHQQRLVQAELEVVAFLGELGDVLRLGAVGVGLGATLDGRQGGQVSRLTLAPPSAQRRRVHALSAHQRADVTGLGAAVAVVDATLIAAPSSTKNTSGERAPEMKQNKKGNQWYFGMKAHIGVDADSGLVHTVRGTTGIVSTIPHRGDDGAISKSRQPTAARVQSAIQSKVPARCTQPGASVGSVALAQGHIVGVFGVISPQYGSRKSR